jgi:hypothetical protein
MCPHARYHQQGNVRKGHGERNLQDSRRASRAVDVHVHVFSVRGFATPFKPSLDIKNPVKKTLRRVRVIRSYAKDQLHLSCSRECRWVVKAHRNRPENTGEQVVGRRITLQLDQFLVEPIQVFIALDKKILNYFVHSPFPPGLPFRAARLRFKETRARAQRRTAWGEKPAPKGVALMFRNLRLSAKLLGAITLVLAITSGISFWILQSRINSQADEAFRDKLRQITGMTAATRTWFAGNIDIMVPDHNFKHLERCPSWWRCVRPNSMPVRRD